MSTSDVTQTRYTAKDVERLRERLHREHNKELFTLGQRKWEEGRETGRLEVINAIRRLLFLEVLEKEDV